MRNEAVREQELLRAAKEALGGAEWTRVHARVTRDAIISGLFYRRWRESVLGDSHADAALVTAHYTAAFVANEAAKRRLGVVRVTGGPVRIEPLGTPGGEVPNMIVLQSGTQGRRRLGGADSEGIEVPLTDTPTAEASQPELASGEIQQRSDGGFDVVYANPLGGGITDPNADPSTFPTVTVRSGDALPLVEVIQIVSGPVTQITGGDVTIEPLGTPAQ